MGKLFKIHYASGRINLHIFLDADIGQRPRNQRQVV